jgi:hypothetical protein
VFVFVFVFGLRFGFGFGFGLGFGFGFGHLGRPLEQRREHVEDGRSIPGERAGEGAG